MMLEFGLRFNLCWLSLGGLAFLTWHITPFTNLYTIPGANSSQLFPNLEATGNSLLFHSTPLPQGTKLSGLLKL